MNNEINYKNNPLHGVSLKSLLIEIEDHYGFEILFAYLNINCFKTNPSIASSVKFLKKTDWAREKVEIFYLYEFKNLPRASSEQFSLSPRDRVIPEDQSPGEPAKLSLEDAQRIGEERAKKSAAYDQQFNSGKRYGAKRDKYSSGPGNDPIGIRENEALGSTSFSNEGDVDPWAKSKNKNKH